VLSEGKPYWLDLKRVRETNGLISKGVKDATFVWESTGKGTT
jgi:hypothetical protein